MNNEQTEVIVTEKELVINMLIAAWEVQHKRFSAFLDKVTDGELAAETAPGRNTGTYLLGHLTAVNDAMLPMLGLGDKLYPEMEDTFIASPDKSGKTMPAASELREKWHNVASLLHEHFKKMAASEWFERHTAVSAEDFAKEPHRNKLNILISRTNHMSYHFGQMAYLIKK
jgi:uncharacterized damage-inducible protein DinB